MGVLDNIPRKWYERHWKELHAIFFRKLRKYVRFFMPTNSKEVYLWAWYRNAIFLSTELISYNFHDVSKTAAEQSIDEDKTKFCYVTTNKVL